MRRYLVVANQTLQAAELRDELRKRISAGPCSFFVIVPDTQAAQYDPVAAGGVLPQPGMWWWARFYARPATDEEATAHLDAMNKMGPLPWRVSFSYGRALQAAPQKTWSGKSENVAAAQRAFGHRAMMNGLATLGQWKVDLERKAA